MTDLYSIIFTVSMVLVIYSLIGAMLLKNAIRAAKAEDWTLALILLSSVVCWLGLPVLLNKIF